MANAREFRRLDAAFEPGSAMYWSKPPHGSGAGDMRDEDLTAVLEQARKDVSPSASSISALVASEVAAQQRGRWRSRRSWRRRGVLIPVGLAVLAGTGAGTYAAYQLTIPPYVATGPGVERVSDPVPVNYRTDAGTRIDCLAYLEFRDVTPVQRRQLNAISTDNWSGYGQRIYDGLPAPHRAVQDGPEELLSDRVTSDLYARARKEAPGVEFRTSDGKPSIEGATIRCTYPDGNH